MQLVVCSQTTNPPPGHCGDLKFDSPNTVKDVLDIKDRGKDAIDMAFAKLQEQVDSIVFDEQAVANWLKSLPSNQIPNFPLIDEGKVIKDISELSVALIKKAEIFLKAELTAQLALTKKALQASFDAAVIILLPRGIFKADASWEEFCCDKTGYWTKPDVTAAGETVARGTASFKAKVLIGASLGLEASTPCEINLNVKLSLALTKWSDIRFWPPPRNGDDDSNQRGCSVTVRALPNWKATYDRELGAGAMLILSLGKGSDLENFPKLREVDAILYMPDPKR